MALNRPNNCEHAEHDSRAEQGPPQRSHHLVTHGPDRHSPVVAATGDSVGTSGIIARRRSWLPPREFGSTYRQTCFPCRYPSLRTDPETKRCQLCGRPSGTARSRLTGSHLRPSRHFQWRSRESNSWPAALVVMARLRRSVGSAPRGCGWSNRRRWKRTLAFSKAVRAWLIGVRLGRPDARRPASAEGCAGLDCCGPRPAAVRREARLRCSCAGGTAVLAAHSRK